MEEQSWKRNLEEKVWRVNQGGEIIEENMWRENHGEKSCRRNDGQNHEETHGK